MFLFGSRRSEFFSLSKRTLKWKGASRGYFSQMCKVPEILMRMAARMLANKASRLVIGGTDQERIRRDSFIRLSNSLGHPRIPNLNPRTTPGRPDRAGRSQSKRLRKFLEVH